MVGLPSTLDVGFAGSADPFCQMLDACGASGSLALSPSAQATVVTLSGSRDIPTHEKAARVLRDFRAGLLRVTYALPLPPLQLRETYAWPGGGQCTDGAPTSRPILGIGAFPGARRGEAIPVDLQVPGPTELLRTHCPGPLTADVFGENHGVIASGSVTPAQLLSPRTTVSLTNPGSFAGPGYTGSRSGAVDLQLQLVSAKAGTRNGTAG